jgi:hypothetical protein
MTRCKLAAIALTVATGAVAFAATRSLVAQDGGAAMPDMKTAEHKVFEKYVGTWDAEMEMGSGAEAQKSKGTSTSKVACGGLFMITDFESTMMGAPFIGHEVTGWDAAAKSYQHYWFDSMTPTAWTGPGRFDAAKSTFHTQMKGIGMSGAPEEFHGIDVWTDADHHTWTMMMKGPDGAEAPSLTIRYTRRK